MNPTNPPVMITTKASYARATGDGYDTFEITYALGTPASVIDHALNEHYATVEKSHARHYNLNDDETSGPASYDDPHAPETTQTTSYPTKASSVPQNGTQSVPAVDPITSYYPKFVPQLKWPHEGKFGQPSYDVGTPVTDIVDVIVQYYANAQKPGMWRDACAKEMERRAKFGISIK